MCDEQSSEIFNNSVAQFDINDAWDTFSLGIYDACDALVDTIILSNEPVMDTECPDPSPLKVSTKTKIAYIAPLIDIYALFWKIPILPYHTPAQGVVK